MSAKENGFKVSHIEKKVHRTVDQTLRSHRMVQNGDALLVAVSGGADSVALAYILLELAPKYSLRLAIAHLNHCLRQSESDRDETFVAALAEQLELPFYVGREDVRRYQERHRLSPEEAARQVRYGFYDAIATKYGYRKIALGHHGDDNAELVLMNLLRGSGPLGLSGISPVRDNKIVRPLINLRRSEIMDYVAAKNLDYVTDSSNWDLKYYRNKIRARLMPELESEYNPKLIDSLNRLTAIMGAEEEWLEDLIHPIYQKAIIFKEKNKLELSIQELNQQPIAVRRRIIRKAIRWAKGDLRRIAFAHVASVCQLAKIGPTSGILDLPDRIRIRRDRNVLTISKEGTNLRRLDGGPFFPATRGYDYSLSGPGKIFIEEAQAHISFIEIPKAQSLDLQPSGHRIAFFDMNKIRFPLVIRNFRPGDRFWPLGSNGNQKLKKFFIDHKVSRIERAKCPIVLSRNKIIWVAGHRLDNAVRIGPRTQRILKAELSLA
jgi:tRNA(Ile)-lysidine synthase